MAMIRSGLPNDPEWEVSFGFPQMDNKVFGPEDLAQIRQQLEELNTVTAVNPAVRALAERYWPDLLPKLPPE
jgi:hypothetical protein